MCCIPVFFILLLLIPSAPSILAQPTTKGDVALASSYDDAKRTLQRLSIKYSCCPGIVSCCVIP
uniref:Conotoxin n=2 Tax=Conus TaxID=6490 RepID=A0A125S9F8_CONIM|nr:conopeptide im024 [Conus imperialis]QFQ61107.1 conotoxin superfamily T [Conus magus]